MKNTEVTLSSVSNKITTSTPSIDLDLIANLVAAVAGMIPYVGSILKPIISYILHSTFGSDDNALFIKIIETKIAEYAQGTAIGEFKSFLETAKLLEISIEQWEQTGSANELIARNEICLNNSLRILNIYMEVSRNSTETFTKVQSIISMSSFMHFGLLLNTIKDGISWGYSTIDGLKSQLENKSDEVFRFLVSKGPGGPYPFNKSALRAQQSLIYFRSGYNNLDPNLEVKLNILNNSSDEASFLKKGRKNILVGKSFSPYVKAGEYSGVAYDYANRLGFYHNSRISNTLRVTSETSGRLEVSVIHSCIGYVPNKTVLEIFFDGVSRGKKVIYPAYYEEQPPMEVLHQAATGSNYRDIRYTKLVEDFISNVTEVKFDVHNNDGNVELSSTLIYQIEAVIV
jgi:hypothetical protein